MNNKDEPEPGQNAVHLLLTKSQIIYGSAGTTSSRMMSWLGGSYSIIDVSLRNLGQTWFTLNRHKKMGRGPIVIKRVAILGGEGCRREKQLVSDQADSSCIWAKPKVLSTSTVHSTSLSALGGREFFLEQWNAIAQYPHRRSLRLARALTTLYTQVGIIFSSSTVTSRLFFLVRRPYALEKYQGTPFYS
jgi:hypothetical protein